MIASLVSLFYLFGFIAAAHAALTTRTSQGAVAWTVSLVSFPFIALPAYLVFGRNKFSGMAEAFRQNQEEAEAFLERFEKLLEPHRVPSAETPSWRHARISIATPSLSANRLNSSPPANSGWLMMTMS